jgi:hypothetical protein
MIRDFFKRRPGLSFFIVFFLALSIRLLLLFTLSDNLRHGSASSFGSAAIGFVYGQGLTTRMDEMKLLEGLRDNVSGDYEAFYISGDRQPLTEFLPGPPLLLGFLWKISGIHNYAPYLLLQLILESLLIAAASIVIVRWYNWLGLLTTIFLIIDFAAIKRTLMMGYDFWPQYAILVFFIGTIWLIGGRRKIWGYLMLGILLAITAWFREITTFLPFFAMPFLFEYMIQQQKLKRSVALLRLALLLLPIVISIFLVSSYRLTTTGNGRPTRSTFWHTFFAGVASSQTPMVLKAMIKAFGDSVSILILPFRNIS